MPINRMGAIWRNRFATFFPEKNVVYDAKNNAHDDKSHSHGDYLPHPPNGEQLLYQLCLLLFMLPLLALLLTDLAFKLSRKFKDLILCRLSCHHFPCNLPVTHDNDPVADAKDFRHFR